MYRDFISTFQCFSETIGDEEMGKVMTPIIKNITLNLKMHNFAAIVEHLSEISGWEQVIKV